MLRRSAVAGALGYVKVQLLWFFLLLFLSTIYFQFTGFQYAALVGVVAALLELIPQFGCGVLYLPWALVCFLIRDSHSGWLILCFYGVQHAAQAAGPQAFRVQHGHVAVIVACRHVCGYAAGRGAGADFRADRHAGAGKRRARNFLTALPPTCTRLRYT